MRATHSAQNTAHGPRHTAHSTQGRFRIGFTHGKTLAYLPSFLLFDTYGIPNAS